MIGIPTNMIQKLVKYWIECRTEQVEIVKKKKPHYGVIC